MEHSIGEALIGIIGVLLTLSFGAWAAVVKKSADDMGIRIDRIITEIAGLREEIHHDRVQNERRFSRLENKIYREDSEG